MDQFPQMLYRAPGLEQIHGGSFDTLIVIDATEYDAARADGFHDRTDEAQAAHLEAQAAAARPASTKPTRENLEARAKELGIEFKPSTSDKALAKSIDEKTASA